MKKLLMVGWLVCSFALTASAQTTDFDATYNAAGNVVIRFKTPAIKAAFLSDFAAAYGYQAQIPNPDPGTGRATPLIPNPESQADFLTRRLEELLSEAVSAVQVRAAAETAAKAEREKQKGRLPRVRD